MAIIKYYLYYLSQGFGRSFLSMHRFIADILEDEVS